VAWLSGRSGGLSPRLTDQLKATNKLTSARPTKSIDQSSILKPGNLTSVLIRANMSPSQFSSEKIRPLFNARSKSEKSNSLGGTAVGSRICCTYNQFSF
jgi:hypothetical protein